MVGYSDEYVHTEWTEDDLHVEIVADNGGLSIDDLGVRDEPLSEIVTWKHDRHGIGDRGMTADEERAMERGGWPLLVRYLRTAKHALCVLPLSGYSHSGETIWVARGVNETSMWDTAGWDSGQWGFVVVFRDRAVELGIPGTPGNEYEWDYSAVEAGTATMPTKTDKLADLAVEAARQARAEVEELDDVMTGNVWGYRISRVDPTDGTEDELESVWGFIGDPDKNAEVEARAALKGYDRQLALNLEAVSA